MDLLGYAALGGLERLTIVAGAVIIGYWGYRLYTAEKNAGLIFMGLAVLVLVGALATGGSHLKSVGEGYQLASLPAQAPAGSPLNDRQAADTPAVDSPMVDSSTVNSPTADNPTADRTASPAIDRPSTDSLAPEDDGADADLAGSAPPVGSDTAPDPAVATGEPMSTAQEAGAPKAERSPVRRLATGAELGGRIVSVKSEKVSLEWSEASGSSDASDPE